MRFWDRLVVGLVRQRAVALSITGVLTIAAIVSIRGLVPASAVTDFLPENVPEVRAWLDLSRRFDVFNTVLVGVEEPNGPFTVDGLHRLQQITRALGEEKARGVLAVRSLTNVESIVEGEDGTLNNELLIASVPTDAEGLETLKKRVLDDREVVGVLVSHDLRGYALALHLDPRRSPPEVARLVRQTVDRLRGPMPAFYFGVPFFTAAVTDQLRARLPWILPAFVVLLLTVLAFTVRRASVIALVLLSAGLATVWCLGLTRLFGLRLSETGLTGLLGVAALGAVTYARGLEECLSRAVSAVNDIPNAFPASLASVLTVLGVTCSALSLSPVHYVSVFAALMAIGALATLLVGLLCFAPLARLLQRDARLGREAAQRFSPRMGVILACAFVLAASWVAWRGRFLSTPQEMFSAEDEVGQTLAFFDRRFGGTDFIQVAIRGDMRDPSVAARALRLSDLIEGAGLFSDVRSIAQILAFLNHGFGGIQRIPTSRESVANLWFFLEGNEDVHSLVSDKRDEAMITVRVPAHPRVSTAELVAAVQSATNESAHLSPIEARQRLEAFAQVFSVPLSTARIEAVIDAASRPPTPEERKALDAEVFARLQKSLGGSDSPYTPTPGEWDKIVAALSIGEGHEREWVAAVADSFDGLKKSGLEKQFIDLVVSREKDLQLLVRTEVLAAQLHEGKREVPPAYLARVQGAVADLLDPPANAALSVPVLVSGYPVVSGAIERNLKLGLWGGALALLLLAGLIVALITRAPLLGLRGTLTGAGALALMVLATSAAGLRVDGESAVIYLLPPILGFIVPLVAGTAPLRLPPAFLLALGAGALALLFSGSGPTTRLGATIAIGFAVVAAVTWSSGRFAARKSQ